MFSLKIKLGIIGNITPVQEAFTQGSSIYVDEITTLLYTNWTNCPKLASLGQLVQLVYKSVVISST